MRSLNIFAGDFVTVNAGESSQVTLHLMEVLRVVFIR